MGLEPGKLYRFEHGRTKPVVLWKYDRAVLDLPDHVPVNTLAPYVIGTAGQVLTGTILMFVKAIDFDHRKPDSTVPTLFFLYKTSIVLAPARWSSNTDYYKKVELNT